MPEKQATKVVAIILIIIAAVFVLGPFSMWMMPSMMGGMMGGCAMCMVGPLLLAAILIVLAVVLLRNRS